MSTIINGTSNAVTFPDSSVQNTSAIVSGYVPYANMPAGSVLQVVNATYATQASSSSSTFADTGLTATITPKFGVAKGKVPAKEQTIARRITADSAEVLVGINQLKHLTESGTRDLSGSTFSETKGDGFLKAPAKAFTNKLSNEDSLMYDSIMYPIVKNMSLFDNPDYRPTDADVKQKMQAYKAGANEPRSVQVQKMAELKNTYMAKAESYLDAGILNANQAASLKKQMRNIEKAIPWDVKDAIDFSRQKEYKTFGEFIKASKDIDTRAGETVSIGGKTYSRPADMSDADWNEYKATVSGGVKK